jgi:hypothetical protein
VKQGCELERHIDISDIDDFIPTLVSEVGFCSTGTPVRVVPLRIAANVATILTCLPATVTAFGRL